ncbi:concanavalin A-like lectin/glucanase domain-containing protein [Paraphoma chrysanthemicola]|nr:concanavalin A-like lectin/glucanase domain-containing protein [Paraphoma chrysanthemicola]
MRFATTLISAAAFFDLCIAGYVLEDDYMTDFYGNFDFFTGADPTEGFVKYVDEATARQTNLINGSATTAAIFGVDVTNKTPGGRPSIRVESKKKYDGGLIVLDVAHMPFGCGTWPAFWTLGPNWPTGGEIDILEGVNEYTNNGMTLHTGPGCAIGSDTTQFSGSVTTPNCDVAAEGQSKNVGCSIEHPSKQSYGAGLNKNGGGVYAMEWNSDAISVYFFPRQSIPADALGDNPNPSAWGKPAAKFAGACDIEKKFAEQQIIIDTTFCGQWAGAIWEDGSCASKAATCDEYVRDNPQAFTEAYWEINALKVYKDDGNDAPAPSAPATPSKSTVISVPVPVSTLKSSLAPVNPPASTSIIASISSAIPVPGVPSKATSAPVVPIPSSIVPVPGAPSAAPPSSRTNGRPSGRPTGRPSARPSNRPTPTLNDQVSLPTGAGGMPGWQWPLGADSPSNNSPSNSTSPATPVPTPSNAPAQPSTSLAVAPTSLIDIALPSQAPSGDSPPAEPSIPAASNAGPADTVYKTVYVTVTEGTAATPAPDAKKARMARHVREHRRRWTQHNARF